MNTVKGVAGFKGTYEFAIVRDGKVIDHWIDTNLIPTEGLNHILNVLTQVATAKVAAWYMGIGTGNYTATAADANATIGTAIAETIQYTGGARKPVTIAPSTAAALVGTPVTFACNVVGPITITNAIISSTSVQGAGVLLSSLKLATAKTLAQDEQLVATFTLSAASV